MTAEEFEGHAAEEFFRILIEGMRDGDGVHAETAIAAAASLAGAQLLRNAGVDLKGIAPGHAVLIESVNQKGQELLESLGAHCHQLGIDPNAGWTAPIPKENSPHKPFLALIGQFEESFIVTCDRNHVTKEGRAKVAALVTALLIHQTSSVLDPEIGKSIAAQAMVFSAKTMPPPLKA